MFDVLQHFKAAAPRHIDVEQQNIRQPDEQLGERLSAIGGFGEASAGEGVGQEFPEAAPHICVIVRYQNVHH